MTPRAETIDVRGLSLRLWDHGGEGRPVLFVHGYLDTGRSFDEVARLLLPDVRALCVDLRGHGESAFVGPGGSYHLLDHVKDLSFVVRWLSERGLAPEALVAHSMGGNVALLLCGARPGCVPRLLLLDALGAPPEDPEDQPARLGEVLLALDKPPRPFPTFATLEEAAARIRENNPGLSDEGALRMARAALRPVASGFTFSFDPRVKGPTPVRWPEAMWRSLCARISSRVAVIRAAEGYVPDDEAARGRLEALRATLVQAPGGHNLHVEEPAIIASTLRELLAAP